MKRLLILFLALFISVGAARSQTKPRSAKPTVSPSGATSRGVVNQGFILTGTVKGLKTSTIYLKYSANGEEHADSVVAKNGIFKFKGQVKEPEMAFLYSPEARFQKIFYVENQPMTIAGSATALDKLTVSGSPVQRDYAALEEAIQANRDQAIARDALARKAEQAGDSAAAKKFKAEFEVLYKHEADIRKQFILDHSQSHASLNELLNWMDDSNFAEAKTIYEGLEASLRQTFKAKEVAERLHNLERIQVGQPAVGFTQQDVDGNPVSLSAYQGKYVLVEFWASWCGPCRAENPNLRKEYLQYKDKGFNILGISLDSEKGKWTKALAKDSLPWTQVSDLKGWKNEVAVQYGIRAIPANFLINPDGKIIARDLRGENLNQKLAALFTEK